MPLDYGLDEYSSSIYEWSNINRVINMEVANKLLGFIRDVVTFLLGFINKTHKGQHVIITS